MSAGKIELDTARLGAKVRELRKERGLTQLQLAEAADMTEQTLCNLENGNKRHQANTIYRIAMALGVSCAVLMDQHVLPGDEDEAFIAFYRERSDANRQRVRQIIQLVFEDGGDDR